VVGLVRSPRFGGGASGSHNWKYQADQNSAPGNNGFLKPTGSEKKAVLENQTTCQMEEFVAKVVGIAVSKKKLQF